VSTWAENAREGGAVFMAVYFPTHQHPHPIQQHLATLEAIARETGIACLLKLLESTGRTIIEVENVRWEVFVTRLGDGVRPHRPPRSPYE
jgi:hypothetical protein